MVASFMKSTYRIHLVDPGGQNHGELSDMLKEIPLDFRITKSKRIGDKSFDKNSDVDLYIVCLPPQEKTDRFSDDSTGTFFQAATLIISDSNQSRIRLWAFRHGACAFLVKPFTKAELHIHMERLLHGQLSEKIATEQYMVTFLKTMQARATKKIEPSLDPESPYAHFYPAVVGAFGKTYQDVDFLENLAEHNLVSRSIHNRVRLCPVCNDSRSNYREVCPKCQAVDIVETSIVHHFSCGHINAESAFRVGPDLICPKCSRTLRHIGLDYEKPSAHFKCNNCSFIFADTKVEFQCLWCGHVGDPTDTIEKPIYTYALTPLSEEVVKTGRINGIDLASLLYNQYTTLYSKQYLEIELKRELLRHKRYGHEFVLLLIRLEGLDAIKLSHPSKLEYYVNTVFKTLSKGLRELDTTCVWDADLLAMLLAGTNKAGAEVVSRRIYQNIKALEYLYSIREPEISVSLIEGSDTFQTPEEMIAQAKADLESETSDSPGDLNGESDKTPIPDERIARAEAVLTKEPEVPGNPIAEPRGLMLPGEAPEQKEENTESQQ